MGFLLGVEIDNSRIVWIYNSERASIPPIRLTTVREQQRRADIKFYLKTANKKHLICTEVLNSLPPMHAGEPSIDIKPHVMGKIFYYEIFINGKPVRSGKKSLRPYIHPVLPFIIAGAAVLAVAAVLFLFFFVKPPVMTVQPSAVPEKVYEKKPPVEKPEPVIRNTDKSAAVPQTAKPSPESGPAAEPSPAPPEPEPEPVPASTPGPAVAEIFFTESEITERHSVYFNPDSAVLLPAEREKLEIFVNELPKRNDFDEAEFEMEVRGHCARYGTEEGRAELSRERAINVYNFLKKEWGIEADSVVTGVGSSEPVSLERDEQYLNRRVDINIKGSIKKKTEKD